MKHLSKLVKSIIKEGVNPPSDWKAGFKDPDNKDSYQDTPLRLMRGETPFQVNGRWYLYVFDEREKDLVVYDFGTDMIIPYEDFQHKVGLTEVRRVSLKGFFSILEG